MRLLLRLVSSVVVLCAAAVLAPTPGFAAAACADCGPPVVSGQVTHHGRPVPQARVLLHVWPPAAELAARPQGALVARPVVATARTDVDGRYSLHLDTDEVRRFRSSSGTVDFQLETTYGGRAASLLFSARPEGKGPAPKWSPTGAQDLHEFDVDLGSGSSVPADGADLCGHVELGRWFYDNREKFLHVHNWPGAQATVEQAIAGSSSHELGLAVKYPGMVWQPQGTLTLTQDETSGSGARVSGIVNKALYNSVNYREIIVKTWSGHEECYRTRRPMGFYDLLNEPHTDITHVRFRKGCTIRRGGEIWKDSQKNQTFRSGLDLGVISVSAQSGYSEGTRVGFTITRPTRICTNNHEGWLKATKFDLRPARTAPAGAV
ncbi:MAG TPA: hypothetical protein VFK52_07540 [Nocardioidaceae bacterium]|nr:hypothetical protein [Nocardioidaceae bacterium]